MFVQLEYPMHEILNKTIGFIDFCWRLVNAETFGIILVLLDFIDKFYFIQSVNVDRLFIENYNSG